MVMATEPRINIGDYIQALAAAQFFDSIDTLIERERLDEYDGEEVKMIMNGWYMHHPEHWPPSPKIRPLFVAFHINSAVRSGLLTPPRSLEYLRKHAPIGCRDLATMEMLQAAGVEAWFSACLTLTLGRRYRVEPEQRDGKCYIVDPFWVVRSRETGRRSKVRVVLRGLLTLAGAPRKVRAVACKLLTQHPSCGQSDEERLAQARELVGKYARASLVVTSRIHCALPCLGLETPVVLVENSRQEETSSCRFGGLRELFHVVTWNAGRLRKCFDHRGPLTAANSLPNKPLWRPYAERLIARCEAFAAEE